MNTSTSSSTSSSTSRSDNARESDDDHRPARSATPQQAEAFAKLLRRKSGHDDDDAPNQPTAGLLAPPRPDLPPAATTQQAPTGAPAIGPSATADAMRCAQVHGAQPAIPLAGAAAEAKRWDVHLGDPLVGGIQLRATASGASAAALPPAAPTWELSLSSSQIGAHTLARHAPRLSERLRSRGVDHDGVQVQGSRQRHTPQDDNGDDLA